MSIPVLATKFYYPPVRQTLVHRLKLVQRLDRGLSRSLVLISAPAGYGKTTLLSDWRASLGRNYPLAWLTLDQEDNDLIRFLTYCVMSLRKLEPDLGEAALSSLQSTRPPHLETILTSVLNDLSNRDHPFALILDDYQVIEEKSIHDGIQFLLEHLPPCMHLVILTRSEPPLPLARLRGRDQLSEIQVNDLRFTDEEMTVFLNQIMSLGLSQDNLRILAQSTEGWIAGLQLAALSMQGRADPNSFIASFKGSYHYIADYLADEVLNRQPDEAKIFLLKTSILERLNGALCDVLTGGTTGQVMLEKLEHNNLFIVPLDDEQNWYRYHHLFAELLQNRLWREYPDLVPKLYRQASDWCSLNGWVSEAILYAMQGADYEQASRLIEQNISQMQRRGELRTLSVWLSKLPEEVMCTKPRLCISYAWALAFSSGAPDKVEKYLKYAEQAVNASIELAESRDLLGQIACIRANVAVYLGDNKHALEMCAQAQDLLSEDNTALRSYTLLMEADASWMLGDSQAARRALEGSIQLSQKTGDLQTALTTMNYLARVLVAHGSLRQASEIYMEAIKLATKLGGLLWPAIGVIYVGLGMLLWEQNDASSAVKCLTEGIALAAQADDIDSLLFGYTTLARIHQAYGLTDQALELVGKAERVSKETKLARDRYRVAARQTRLMLAIGDIQGADRWSKELSNCVQEYSRQTTLPTLSPLRISEQVMRARVMIARGQYAQADQLLLPLLMSFEAAGRKRNVIEILTLQAVALQAQDNLKQATNILLRALIMAEPEGFIRLFVDEGKPMAQLLSRIRIEGKELKVYVSKLLAAFEPGEPRFETYQHSPTSKVKQLLVKPLSTRELEVLRLIATGCSNSDIAGGLVIAVGTVKRHTANIFNKLDVRNRTEAVARARELDLL